MKTEFQKHKKSDKIKWAITGVMLFLITVLLAGVCLQIFSEDDKYKPSEWFKKPETEQIQPYNDDDMAVLASSRSMAKTTSVSVSENDEIMPYEDTVSEPTWWNNSSTYKLVADNYAEGCFTFIRGAAVDSNPIIDNYSNVDIRYINNGGSYLVVCKANIFPNNDYTLESVSVYIYSRVSATNSVYTYNIECLPYTYLAGSIRVGGYISAPFSMNCAAIDGNSMSNNDVELSISLFLKYGHKSCPLPDDPVKEGYTFVGWYFDSAFTQPYDGSPIYVDTQLFAKFEINQFTVTFNSDGGSTIDSLVVDWNTVLTPKTPTKTGYTFTGWYYSDGTKYENQPVTDDVTLTAQWERIMCSVTFYVDGEIYEVTQVAWGTKFIEVVDVATSINLQVMSLSMADGAMIDGDFADSVVSGDIDVTASIMDGVDKVVNAVKNNKWQVIGGAVGIVALVAIIAAVCSSVKRKKRK